MSDPQANLKQLLTLDYGGKARKHQALQDLLDPLFGAMILAEANCMAGSPESNYVAHLLRTFHAAGLGPSRTHEEYEAIARSLDA